MPTAREERLVCMFAPLHAEGLVGGDDNIRIKRRQVGTLSGRPVVNKESEAVFFKVFFYLLLPNRDCGLWRHHESHQRAVGSDLDIFGAVIASLSRRRDESQSGQRLSKTHVICEESSMTPF